MALLYSGERNVLQKHYICLCFLFLSYYQDKDRHDSSSSDSGILSLRPNDFSPPVSPLESAGYAEVYEQETDLV